MHMYALFIVWFTFLLLVIEFYLAYLRRYTWHYHLCSLFFKENYNYLNHIKNDISTLKVHMYVSARHTWHFTRSTILDLGSTTSIQWRPCTEYINAIISCLHQLTVWMVGARVAVNSDRFFFFLESCTDIISLAE